MAQEDREQQGIEAKARAEDAAPDEDDDEDDAPSPFDHPAFLPVLLWGLAGWFGYDGWINQDPDMLEHVTFNRWGFAVLVALGVYFTIQSVREMRADRENESA
jgi:hypothetical protein